MAILQSGASRATCGDMFLTLPPAPALAAIVDSYWFIEDIPGNFSGQPICTSPIPLAVLSVNLGRPNAAENGSSVPDVSLLGLQSGVRKWRSGSNTYFVMAMLTVNGVVRLFPHTGQGSAGKLLDLGAITGDAGSGTLLRDVTAALEPWRIAAAFDDWLIARMASCAPVGESQRLAVAHASLQQDGSVATAARIANADRRQLQRWFRKHIGIGPKDLADLERLHDSLKAVQTSNGDPVAGFSDQAHQIRSWRRRLGITPGAYGQRTRSPIAVQFRSTVNRPKPAFYL